MNAPNFSAVLSTMSEWQAKQARKRGENEARLNAMLRDYIIDPEHGSNREYSFGGVVNLLTTIADICREMPVSREADWDAAANAIDECAKACDLKYPMTQVEVDEAMDWHRSKS